MPPEMSPMILFIWEWLPPTFSLIYLFTLSSLCRRHKKLCDKEKDPLIDLLKLFLHQSLIKAPGHQSGFRWLNFPIGLVGGKRNDYKLAIAMWIKKTGPSIIGWFCMRYLIKLLWKYTRMPLNWMFYLPPRTLGCLAFATQNIFISSSCSFRYKIRHKGFPLLCITSCRNGWSCMLFNNVMSSAVFFCSLSRFLGCWHRCFFSLYLTFCTCFKSRGAFVHSPNVVKFAGS